VVDLAEPGWMGAAVPVVFLRLFARADPRVLCRTEVSVRTGSESEIEIEIETERVGIGIHVHVQVNVARRWQMSFDVRSCVFLYQRESPTNRGVSAADIESLDEIADG